MRAAAFLLTAHLLAGCGGAAAEAAHEALAATARGLYDVEQTVGNAEAAERRAVVEEQVTQSEGRRRLSSFWRVESVDRLLRALLFAAERALDAQGADGFAEIAPCIAASIAELGESLEVLAELGVHLPDYPWIEDVLTYLSAYGSQCEGRL